MTKQRYYGPPIYLSSDLQLALTMTVTGTGSYVYDGSLIAYPTVPAGYYSFNEFAILVSQKIRQWMFDVANSGASAPVPIGTVDSILFTLDWVPSILFNGSRVNFTIVDPSCTMGGTKAAVSQLQLVAGWPHYLGLAQESANANGSIVGPYGAVVSGVFCPRAINSTLRSEVRSRYRKTTELHTIMPLSDGAIEGYQIASGRADVSWTIKDNTYAISGDPFPVGTCQSIKSDRLSIYCAYPKVTGRVTGFTGGGLYGSYLPVGSYLGIEGAGAEGFVSRVKQIITPGTEGGANRLEIVLWEKVPNNFAVKTPSPLYRVPDAWAARFDAKRLDCFLLYGAEDLTGDGLWICEDWILEGDGTSFVETNERRNDTNNQYSLTFNGARRALSKLTLVTT